MNGYDAGGGVLFVLRILVYVNIIESRRGSRNNSLLGWLGNMTICVQTFNQIIADNPLNFIRQIYVNMLIFTLKTF